VADTSQIADEIQGAYAGQRFIAPFTGREGGLDLTTAYAVEAELTARRRAAGQRTVGLKVGYANKAVWRALKLDTLVWARMYDSTVSHATDGRASLSLASMTSAKIEPEIVFAVKSALPAGLADATAVLAHVESIALGFEIIDCVYADWKFQPADFVAAYGLHAALVVGQPRRVEAGASAALAGELAQFKLRLLKDGEVVAEGGGRNSLRSPALCVAELASAIANRPGEEPLEAGEIVSTGTLTEPQPIQPGETWSVAVEGIDLPPVALVSR
jgi:2-oxo-3-hexenedioate decarboxylase